MILKRKLSKLKSYSLLGITFLMSISSMAQTNVFDDIIATSPDHTYLTAALQQEGLDNALRDPLATYTVFAPTNAAFDNLATALNTDIAGLLALPNLTDVLLYHVLGTQVASTAISNGAIVNPLSTTNSLKLTLKSNDEVFVNQAKVTTADVTASNGTVHVLDAVLLPVETVADVAIDNGFSTLVIAVIQQELLPALTNPLATYTVFAPTNAAFDNLATALSTDIPGILALPNLTNILLYHVLNTEVLSSELTNGFVPTLSGQNILVDLSSGVKINDANVITANVLADNGVVHVIDKVLLPTFVGVEETSISPELNIFPNPTSDFLRIDTQFDGSFEIFDFYGKKIISGNLKNQIVDVTSLPSGNYAIRFIDNNKVSQNKFVKL